MMCFSEGSDVVDPRNGPWILSKCSADFCAIQKRLTGIDVEGAPSLRHSIRRSTLRYNVRSLSCNMRLYLRYRTQFHHVQFFYCPSIKYVNGNKNNLKVRHSVSANSRTPLPTPSPSGDGGASSSCPCRSCLRGDSSSGNASCAIMLYRTRSGGVYPGSHVK